MGRYKVEEEDDVNGEKQEITITPTRLPTRRYLARPLPSTFAWHSAGPFAGCVVLGKPPVILRLARSLTTCRLDVGSQIHLVCRPDISRVRLAEARAMHSLFVFWAQRRHSLCLAHARHHTTPETAGLWRFNSVVWSIHANLLPLRCCVCCSRCMWTQLHARLEHQPPVGGRFGRLCPAAATWLLGLPPRCM